MMRQVMRGVPVLYSRWISALRLRRQVKRNAALSAQLVQMQEGFAPMIQAMKEMQTLNRIAMGEANNQPPANS